MKIAEFVSSEYPYPLPPGVVYAPINIVGSLADRFCQAGHKVTWLAPIGTKTPARVESFGIRPVRLQRRWSKIADQEQAFVAIPGFYDSVFLSHLARIANQFDIVHLHNPRIGLPFARQIDCPVVMTLHSPTGTPTSNAYIKAHEDLDNVHYVAISEYQRQRLPEPTRAVTIYHGLDVEQIPWSNRVGRRWLFAGRMVKNKGPHIAIKLAKKLGEPLDLAGPIHLSSQEDTSFFKTEIKPHLDGKQIRYLGSKSSRDLQKLYLKAKGFLFPLQWDEPFGLCVVEAMAAGTPVVAFPRGSLPELVDDGKTGFLVKSEISMLKAMQKIDQLNRQSCREVVAERFSLKQAADNYLKLFEQLNHSARK